MFQKRYVIAGYVDQIPRLLEAGVQVKEMTIEDPDDITGISFPVDQRELAESVLNIPRFVNEQKTDKRGVTILQRGRASCLSTHHIHGVDEIHRVIDEYAKKWNKNIVYYNPHGQVDVPEPIEVNTLYLLFWSVPRDSESHKYKFVFVYDLSGGQEDGFEATEDATDLLYDKDHPYAQIEGDVCYVLFDLPHAGADHEALLRAVMNAWEEFRSPDTTRTVEEKNALAAARVRAHYVQICSGRSQEEIAQLEREISAWNEQLETARKKILDANRNKDSAERRKKVLEEQLPCLEELLLKEYDNLLKNPKIQSIQIRGYNVQFHTTHLKTSPLKEDNTVRDLGEYLIKINIGTGAIVFENLTRKVGDKAHPHAYDNGTMCFGNIDVAVAKFVGLYQFAPLLNLLLKFLENPNENDRYGRRIYSWPLVEEVSK